MGRAILKSYRRYAFLSEFINFGKMQLARMARNVCENLKRGIFFEVDYNCKNITIIISLAKFGEIFQFFAIFTFYVIIEI